MRLFLQFFIIVIFLFSVSCAGNRREALPLDTLMAYTTAIKKKDTTTMKLLLSEASLKMAEQQANAQKVTVDDIVKNENFFIESQTKLEYRNQKIEGDRATIEVKNPSNSWDVVPFVREEGVWKLDKQGIATQMQQQTDFDNKRLDDIINQTNTEQNGTFNPTIPQNGANNSNIKPLNETVNPTNQQTDMIFTPTNKP